MSAIKLQPLLLARSSDQGGFTPTSGTLGVALRSARRRAGLSSFDAAGQAGISVPLLSLIERGEHPLTSVSTRNLARLNLAFGLSWPAFLVLILPVYGRDLPYLGAARPVTSRLLSAPGTVGAGLAPACQNGGMTPTMPVPDFAGISEYPDADLLVLHVTPDSLACLDARATVPVDSYAIFNTRLVARAGDVVAVWLSVEQMGALRVFEQSGRGVILDSYRQNAPVVASDYGDVRGVYVGHMATGRRVQPERRNSLR